MPHAEDDKEFVTSCLYLIGPFGLIAHPQGVRFWAIRQADRYLVGPTASPSRHAITRFPQSAPPAPDRHP